MKKITAFISMSIMTAVICAFSVNFTAAFFSDRNTAAGTSVSAGYLDIDVEPELANYGVPGDVLSEYFGNNPSPETSKITVTNNGTVEVYFTLYLTVDAYTGSLLKSNGLRIIDAGNISYDPVLTDTDSLGAKTYSFAHITQPTLAPGESCSYGLELMFLGVELTDGNEHQGKMISVTPMVTANQTGGAQ